jgi:hypothetical protein
MMPLLLQADTTPTYMQALVTSWENACRISGYECETVPMPALEHRDLSSLGRGVRGAYYWGSKTVLIDDDIKLDDPLFINVLIHEIVHYLQENAPDNNPNMWRCQRENEAWNVGNIWSLEQGDERLIIRDWWRAYPGCGPGGRSIPWSFFPW